MSSLCGPLETADIVTSSEDYASRFAGRVGAWFLKIQEEATLRFILPYPNGKVLDVGGGHGQLTGALARKDYQLTVLGSAEICKARIQSWIDQGTCDFRVGNILRLPYPDKSFDVVLSFRLLPHVSQWKLFLAELARVAEKAIILDYPEIQSINFFAPHTFRLKKRLEGNTRPYACFRGADLLEVFSSHGFVRSARFPEFFFPMVFHRKLNSPKISSWLERFSRRVGLTGRFGSPVILKLVRQEG
jgi:SAM-dependent methyltransferase